MITCCYTNWALQHNFLFVLKIINLGYGSVYYFLVVQSPNASALLSLCSTAASKWRHVLGLMLHLPVPFSSALWSRTGSLFFSTLTVSLLSLHWMLEVYLQLSCLQCLLSLSPVLCTSYQPSFVSSSPSISLPGTASPSLFLLSCFALLHPVADAWFLNHVLLGYHVVGVIT